MKQIFLNAVFHTMDGEQSEVRAVYAVDGKIVFTGSEAEVIAKADKDAQFVDLGSAHAYPGLVDSHLHILNLAITARELVLNGIESREEVIDRIKQRASVLPKGSDLSGRGFNEDLWSDSRLITRKELDEIAPEHAVRLTRVCGHMVIVNSLAIDKAHITAETPVPDGGTFDFENGIFCENAINLVSPDNDGRDAASCEELLYEGLCAAADAGLTAIYSDDIGTGGYGIKAVTEAYKKLDDEGRMPVRVIEQCALPDDESFDEFLSMGFYYGWGDDYFRIGPRKLYIDGSLGARTAWLSRPYADAPDKQGVHIYSGDELKALAVKTHKTGMPFIVHAIGDGGVGCVIEAIKYARREVPGSEQLPSGIVHCQITDKAQLDEIAKEHIVIYAQPVFTEYDLHICKDRVGEEKEKTSYAWATLKRCGVNISSGSDCPVEPLDPNKNIYCAVTRKDFKHYPEGGWTPDERLTVHEAIECHTVEAAEAIGAEDRMGKIKAGYLCDMTVFPCDLEKIDPDEILETKPVMTIVSGKMRLCTGR